MQEPIAITGDYVDLKFIQGRKVARVFIEIPIEHANAFIEGFGTPDAASPVKVAIARMSNGPASGLVPASPPKDDAEGQEKRRHFRDLPRSQQAAIKCRDWAFQEWLHESTQTEMQRRTFLTDGDYTLAVLKEHLGITSRKELDTMPAKSDDWDALITSFDTRGYQR